MSNTFLIFKTIHQEDIRVNIDNIASYKQEAHFITLTTKQNEAIQLFGNVEDLDKALSESYFMIKKVEYVG